MSAYWDAVANIAAELRTKPRSAAVFCLYGIEEKLKNTTDEDDKRAHLMVSYAVDRVMTEILRKELLEGTTIEERIAHVRAQGPGFAPDPLDRLGCQVIEANLDELFPDASDKALDTFDDRFPHDKAGENWHGHLADHYAAAHTGVSIR